MSAVDARNRPSTNDERARLKLATKSSLRDGGGAKAIVDEGLVRVGEASLSRASVHSEANDEHFVALDVALDLDRIAGEPRHARVLAEMQGWRLVPAGVDLHPGDVNHAGINRLQRGSNDLELYLREAIEDGIDAVEATRALEILERLDCELASKRAKLLAIVRRGVGE